MTEETDRTEDLGEDACWARLRTGEVARLAVIVEGRPEIFPINYVVDRGSLVFRTAEGTKVHAALSTSGVALEVDGVDAPDDTADDAPEGGPEASAHAWSVVVKGSAEQITGTKELMGTTELPLTPWQTGTKGKFVRIHPTEVTGRRFPVATPEQWRTSVTGLPHAADE
ncbi:MAG TPA: pyridoxamine 5'-phosphate oxidase family protein [Citricoccus sp.]